jgi:carbon starvation protein
MPRTLARILWAVVAIAAAVSMGTIAQSRGEPVNSTWLVVAAVCTYLIGYRFYAAFIAAKVMVLDNIR